MTDKAIFVSFGRHGHRIEFEYVPDPSGNGGRSGTLSGYDRPETWKVSEESCSIPDGTPVFDSRVIPEPDLIDLVFKGPVLDSSLPENSFSRLFDGVAGSNTPRFRPFDGEPLRALDSVSVDLYLALYRKAGARFGRIQNGVIEWEA